MARLLDANPDVQKDWQIMNGKDSIVKFYLKDSANLDVWPRLPHPWHKAPQRMCQKFQVKGSYHQG
jgi:hypothetical protein